MDPPNKKSSQSRQFSLQALGLAYVFAYLGVVLLVPILLLAAAMLAGWKKLSRSRAAAAAKADDTTQTRCP